MAFARTETGILNHPKFMGLDPAAIGLWTMGNAYCADQLTDGRIPRAQVPRLISATFKRCYILADLLVSARLWERDGQDYQVHDWLQHNPPAAKIKADREAARDRMQRRRRGSDGTFSSPERSPERSPARSPARSRERSSTKTEMKTEIPPNPPGQGSHEPGNGYRIHDGMFNAGCTPGWTPGLCVKTEFLDRVPFPRQCDEHRPHTSAPSPA